MKTKRWLLFYCIDSVYQKFTAVDFVAIDLKSGNVKCANNSRKKSELVFQGQILLFSM